MQLRVFVLGLGAVLFLVGCGDSKPRAVIDSSDIEGIREFEANKKKMEALMEADEEAGEL